MSDNNLNKVKKAQLFNKDKDFASFAEQIETNDKLDILANTVKSIEFPKPEKPDFQETNKILSEISENLKKSNEKKHELDLSPETREQLKGQDGHTPTKEELEAIIKPLIPPLIPEPKNGKDAKPIDEEKLIQIVLSKLPEPKEYKLETAQSLIEKLESLEGEDRLDFSALKNVPEFKEKGGMVIGGSRYIRLMADVAIDKQTLADGQAFTWDATINKWVNSTISGGGMTIGDPVVGGDPYDVIFVDGSGNLGQNDNFTYNPDTFQTNIGNAASVFFQDGTTGTTTISSYGMRQLYVNDSPYGLQILGDIDGDWYEDLLKIDNPNRQISFQDAGEMYLLIDNNARIYQMGDIDSVGYTSVSTINDNTQSFTFSTNYNSVPTARIFVASADGGDATVNFGDVDSANNSTSFALDDSSSFMKMYAHNGLQLYDPDTSGQWMNINPHAGLVQLGDITPVGNGTLSSLNDGNQSVSFVAGDSTKGSFYYSDTLGNTFIEAKNASGNWNFGIGDLSDAYNGSAFTISDGLQSASLIATNQFTYTDINGNLFLQASPSSMAYGLGDLNGVNNLTNLFIDDNVQQVTMSSGAITNIIGLTLDFSGGYYLFGPQLGTNIEINDGSQLYIFNEANFLIAGASYVFPSSYPSGTTYLQNDGVGNLTWSTVSGSLAIGASITGSNPNLILFSDASNDLAQSPDFSYDFTGETFNVGFAGHSYLNIDNSSGHLVSQWGDITGAGNHSLITITDSLENIAITMGGNGLTSSGFFVGDTANNVYFSVFPTGSGEVLVQMGAIASGNGTSITIDDVTELITVTNVPTYATDAAAIGAGLTTGQLYKFFNAVTARTELNIVP